MADEIISTLGFDVGGAIQSLTRLDEMLATSAQSFQSFGAAIGSWNSQTASTLAAFSQIAAGANATATALKALAAAQASIKAIVSPSTPTTPRGPTPSGGQGEHNNWMLTPETFARIMQTQLLVRSLNAVRDAFTESYESALKFSKQVSEIHAVDSGRNFGQIADDLRKLSDSFNQPIGEVAEAQYQAISNQFASAAERANILTAANALSKTTAQSLGDAVQVLAGQLNAYGESSDKAGLRASQLFTTVQLGHMRLSDLQSALGRVQSVAVEAGVSIEELEASLVTLSLGGLKASEASTQLRGVMTAFLKPSEGMKQALHEIGVASGDDAIATWGLQEALVKVLGTTDGSTSAIAKLLPNVRGLAGALRMAEEGAEKYHEAMAKIGQSDYATLVKKREEFTSTDAERLTREFNKIGNFFTTQFGSDLVSNLRQVVDVLGGADGIVGSLSAITKQLPVVTAGVISFGVAFGGAKLAAFLTRTEMAAMGTGLPNINAQLGMMGSKTSEVNDLFVGTGNAIGAAKVNMLQLGVGLAAAIPLARSLGEILAQKWISRIDGPQENLRNTFEKDLDTRKQWAEASIRIEDQKNKTLIRGLLQVTAEANKSYLQDQDNFKSSLKVQEQLAKLAFDNVTQTRHKLTQELFTAADAAEKKAASIPDTIAAIKMGVDDRKFNIKTTSLGDLEAEYRANERRTRELASNATKLQGSAKDSNEEKLADAAWKRADSFAKQTEELAKQSGNYDLIVKSQKLMNDLDGQRIVALNQQRVTQQGLSSELEARGHQAEQHSAELDELRLKIEGKLKTTTKDANGDFQSKGKDEIKKDLQAAGELITEFKKKYQQYGAEDFIKNFAGDTRAFEELKRQMERASASYYLTKIEATPEAINGLVDGLQESLNQAVVQFPVWEMIANATGKDLLTNTFADVAKEFGDVLGRETARGINQGKLLGQQMDAMSLYAGARDPLREDLKRPTSRQEAGSNEAARTSDAERSRIRLAVTDLDLLMRSADISGEKLAKVKGTLDGVDWAKAFPMKSDQAKAAAELQSMYEAVFATKKILDEQKENASDITPPELNKIKEGLNGIQPAAEAVKDKLSSVNSTSMGSLISQIQDATDAMYQLASASASIGRPMTAACGGRAFLANGGRGTDTIPAMLSPGEMVMSAKASQAWSSQLIAMNAGVQPAFRASGGTVTNVGDISVTVNGAGKSGAQTGREIAQSLRRELRRGTAIL